MRILYLITKSECGGSQRHLLDLMYAFQELSSTIHLGVGCDGYLAEHARALGIGVTILPSLVHEINPFADVAAVASVVALIRNFRPDVVHCHCAKPGLVGRLAAFITGTPAVFTAHGWEFARGLPFVRRLLVYPCEWVAARLCSRIITVCESDFRTAQRALVAFPPKVTTVLNGVADSTIRAAPGAGGPPVQIVSVARLAPPKDFTTLLSALARVSAPWRLTLVGDGPLRPQIEAEARTRGVLDRICLLGEQSDVVSLLARAHVFVICSRKEGLPISLIEALRAGLPAVGSDVGGIREAISDGGNGYCVPARDVWGLAGAVSQICADSQRRQRMGAESRRIYESKFMLHTMIEGTLAVYAAAMSNGGSTTATAPEDEFGTAVG